jgi:cytoskeletal protein CcmA (bactofilin family)
MFGREKEKAAVAAPQAASSTQNTYGAGVQGRTSSASEGQMPKVETIIGANCRFNGTLQSDGGVRIDGIFEGNLHTTGNVIVSESATIVAEVAAYNVTISGMVKGNITANKVEITETGKLWGDLNVNAILLHEGAYLEGQTNMANAVAPPTLEPSRLGRAPQLGSPSRGDAGKDEA